MGPRGIEIDDSTPEDVAALYQWANLTGARYRDFSASRREQRAQMRLRTARQQLERQLEAQAAAGTLSAEAVGERVAAARRSEVAAGAALRAIEEEREIAEAHKSARRKQMAFEQAEQRRRERTGPQPGGPGGRTGPSAAAAHTVEAQRKTGSGLEGASDMPIAPFASVAIRPAWLEPATELLWPEETATTEAPAITSAAPAVHATISGATLMDSRAQVASRWPVLRALLREAGAETSAAAARMSWPRGPVVAVVAPVGGAGRTSLAATVARALARAGERVLLVETAAHGLMPFYFGMERLEAGEVRIFAREGEPGSVSLIALDTTGVRAEKRAQESMIEALLRNAKGCDRVVLDLAQDASWMVQRLATLKPMVLASIAPDMNSVACLHVLEQAFVATTDRDGRALLPFYVLNRFDSSLPLHLDIREVLRREFGERLLKTTVRRSAAVGEALAEGMTVLDYAAGAPVTRDYTDVAAWLGRVSPASAEAIAQAARSER